MDRFAVTCDIACFAVAREVRGSRPMGIVAHLSNVYRGTLQGCSAAVNSPREARILFPASPTCGIIPPHRGSIGIRFRQTGRIH
jgi:hypothetical protein